MAFLSSSKRRVRPIIRRRHREPLCGFESDEGPEQKERSTNSAAEGQSRGLKRKQSTRPKRCDPLLHVEKGAGYLNSTLPEEQAKLFNRRTKEKKQNESVEKRKSFTSKVTPVLGTSLFLCKHWQENTISGNQRRNSKILHSK